MGHYQCSIQSARALFRTAKNLRFEKQQSKRTNYNPFYFLLKLSTSMLWMASLC
ncbi:Hypothetical predicted protein [Olea europaea subsp. europaea]|uniref:Uncharacterized protein n=1 Tax=Olea europaea subsp. europaea TaxID=158383 RepID=A0A8S0PKA8_OLEEU|nr:Hypothetical predicted protein [Olea europaea subsp. europaea]